MNGTLDKYNLSLKSTRWLAYRAMLNRKHENKEKQ